MGPHPLRVGCELQTALFKARALSHEKSGLILRDGLSYRQAAPSRFARDLRRSTVTLDNRDRDRERWCGERGGLASRPRLSPRQQLATSWRACKRLADGSQPAPRTVVAAASSFR